MSQQGFQTILLLFSSHVVAVLIEVQHVGVLYDLFQRGPNLPFLAVILVLSVFLINVGVHCIVEMQSEQY